jgi:hypothetical protein
VPVLSQESEQSCICVLEVSILKDFSIEFWDFSIEFWNGSDSVVFFVFHFIVVFKWKTNYTTIK